jgi:hypothetical protein
LGTWNGTREDIDALDVLLVGAALDSSRAASPQQLEITGFHDDALRAYTLWQQSKVRDPSLKNEFGKACDAALKAGFDLEQIHEKQNSDFFVQEGVIPGVAERFPRDILPWSQTQRGDCT